MTSSWPPPLDQWRPDTYTNTWRRYFNYSQQGYLDAFGGYGYVPDDYQGKVPKYWFKVPDPQHYNPLVDIKKKGKRLLLDDVVDWMNDKNHHGESREVLAAWISSRSRDPKRSLGLTPHIRIASVAVHSLAEEGAWCEALEVLKASKEEDHVDVDIQTKIQLLRTLLAHNHSALATSLGETFLGINQQGDEFSHKTYHDGWGGGEDLGGMEEKVHGIYSLTMKGFFRDGKWEKAVSLLRTQAERNLAVRLKDFEACLDGCTKARQWRVALDILRISAKVLPDRPRPIFFHKVLEAMRPHGEWQRGIQIMRAIRKATFRLDASCYTPVIASAVNSKAWQAAIELTQHMKLRGIFREEDTYVEALRACKIGGPGAKSWAVRFRDDAYVSAFDPEKTMPPDSWVEDPFEQKELQDYMYQPPRRPVRFFVRTLTGSDRDVFLDEGDHISDIKVLVYQREAYLPQYIWFKGRRLQDHRTIAHYGISDYSLVYEDESASERENERLASLRGRFFSYEDANNTDSDDFLKLHQGRPRPPSAPRFATRRHRQHRNRSKQGSEGHEDDDKPATSVTRSKLQPSPENTEREDTHAGEQEHQPPALPPPTDHLSASTARGGEEGEEEEEGKEEDGQQRSASLPLTPKPNSLIEGEMVPSEEEEEEEEEGGGRNHIGKEGSSMGIGGVNADGHPGAQWGNDRRTGRSFSHLPRAATGGRMERELRHYQSETTAYQPPPLLHQHHQQQQQQHQQQKSRLSNQNRYPPPPVHHHPEMAGMADKSTFHRPPAPYPDSYMPHPSSSGYQVQHQHPRYTYGGEGNNNNEEGEGDGMMMMHEEDAAAGGFAQSRSPYYDDQNQHWHAHQQQQYHQQQHHHHQQYRQHQKQHQHQHFTQRRDFEMQYPPEYRHPPPPYSSPPSFYNPRFQRGGETQRFNYDPLPPPASQKNLLDHPPPHPDVMMIPDNIGRGRGDEDPRLVRPNNPPPHSHHAPPFQGEDHRRRSARSSAYSTDGSINDRGGAMLPSQHQQSSIRTREEEWQRSRIRSPPHRSRRPPPHAVEYGKSYDYADYDGGSRGGNGDRDNYAPSQSQPYRYPLPPHSDEYMPPDRPMPNNMQGDFAGGQQRHYQPSQNQALAPPGLLNTGPPPLSGSIMDDFGGGGHDGDDGRAYE